MDNPLKKYVKEIVEAEADEISVLKEKEDSEPIGVAFFIKKIKKHIDKNQNEMAFLDISDGITDCSLTIFSSDWKNIKEQIKIGRCSSSQHLLDCFSSYKQFFFIKF